MLAVAAVLLIACANLGSLLLAHSQSRVREFAVRAAIGGAASRIARQLLVESLMLALIGGAAGVWLARSLVKGLVAVYPTQLPRADEIALDWRVLLVALGATILAGVLAGLPLGASGSPPRSRPRPAGGRARTRESSASASPRRSRHRPGGDVGRAAVRGRPARAHVHGHVGDRARVRRPQRAHVQRRDLTVRATRPTSDAAAFYNALVRLAARDPGVQDVAWGMFTPLAGGGWGDSFVRVGSADAAPNLPSMQVKMVSPTYASTLRVPLVAGRALDRNDRPGAPDVALVNAALAATYYPGTSPVGKRIVFQKRTLEIVGVIGDVRNQSLWTPAGPELYVPDRSVGMARRGDLRSRGDGAPFDRGTRADASCAPWTRSIPLVNVRTLDERVKRSMAPERFRAILIGTLAALALLLSVLGIYGLVAWIVGRRTREIGIRMALGQGASRVQLQVLGDALRLGAFGIAIGAALAYGSAGYLRAFVAGNVRARDPMMLGATMMVLLIVTAVAAWLPARRASKVDPSHRNSSRVTHQPSTTAWGGQARASRCSSTKESGRLRRNVYMRSERSARSPFKSASSASPRFFAGLVAMPDRKEGVIARWLPRSPDSTLRTHATRIEEPGWLGSFGAACVFVLARPCSPVAGRNPQTPMSFSRLARWALATSTAVG